MSSVAHHRRRYLTASGLTHDEVTNDIDQLVGE
jgi:hypothetical protein